MHHHRRVHCVEGSLTRHVYLAGAALFCGRAHDADPSAGGLCHKRSGEAGAQAGGADDVVAARVADTRQRVVFAQHRNCRAGGADAGVEGRLQVVGVTGGSNAVALE